MKKFGLILLIAMLALVGSGCTVTQNISGHGSVALVDGEIAGETFVPGEATFSLNFACYAQNNNRVEGYLKWNDPANGVQISATLPETPVKAITNGVYTTCKAMKAAASTAGFSVNTAGIYSQNGNADGNAGTLTGVAMIAVSKPGLPEGNPCGPTGTAVMVVAQTQQIPMYEAMGCLDRGKIVFGGGGQNQQ